MRISRGIEEGGVVVGNVYDKYGSGNPVVRRIMKGFRDTLNGLVAKVGPSSIHEIGCGEGYWVLEWRAAGMDARGSDFSETVIEMARSNATARGLPPSIFSRCSVYDIYAERDRAELLVCCEVLEHLEQPEKALSALQRVASDFVILSVPREPVWCVLNMIRAKYLASFGNTPGHIQHWSTGTFIDLVGRYFEIVEVARPLPWTMLLCRIKRAEGYAADGSQGIR